MFLKRMSIALWIIVLIFSNKSVHSYSKIISGVHVGDIFGNTLLANDILVERSSQITGNILLSADSNILTFEHSGSLGATMLFGTISLKGLENTVDLGNALIQGNIEMGKSSSNFLVEDTLFLKGANVYGKVTMSANQNTIHFGENSHISGAIIMEGILANSFYLEDNATLRTSTISIGKNQNNNLLSLGNNTMINGSNITMTGLKNTIIVGNNVNYTASTITVANSAHIILHTAAEYSPLFNLSGVTENMELTFANGFTYTGNIVLDIGVAQNAFTKTLALEGANIVGDIILSEGWKIDFSKAMQSDTLFTGVVRNEHNEIIGLGISDGQKHLGDITVTNLRGAIYIRGSSLEGSLITSYADIYIKDSFLNSLHVGENPFLTNHIVESVFREKVSYTSTNFISNSTISNSVFGESVDWTESDVLPEDRLVLANSSGNLTIHGTTFWGNIVIGSNPSAGMSLHFQDTNVVYGNILGDSNTDLTIDSLTFYGDRISAGRVSVHSIDFNKRVTTSTIIEKKYIEASEILLVDNNGKSSIPFQSVNAIANDIEIYIDGAIMDRRGEHKPVFLVDVSFKDQNSDKIILDKATFISSRNDIFAFALTEPIRKAERDLSIQNVITGVSPSTGIRPELFSNVIGGYEVELHERFDTVAGTNSYDLIVKGISAATISYSAVVDKGRRYTQAFWSGMKEGMRNRESFTINNGSFSMWTNNSYTFSKNITNTYTGKEDLFVSLVGIGGRQEIFSGLFLSYDLAGGYGVGNTDIVAKGVPTKGDVEAKSIAFQINLEKVLAENHTFFVGLIQWGDILANTVVIGELKNRTTWNTLSASAAISLGYTYSFSFFTIGSQIDTLYSFTEGVNYIAEDNTIIEIKHENRVYILPSVVFIYVNSINLNPFISAGVSVPIYKERKESVLINGYDVLYRKDKPMLQVDVGLRYTYSNEAISLLLYGTTGVEMPIDKQNVLDISFDVGFGFAF
ncbi:MAG: hypothetical protein ACRCV3_05040 [Desulfovibrionaceae bacterium]